MTALPTQKPIARIVNIDSAVRSEDGTLVLNAVVDSRIDGHRYAVTMQLVQDHQEGRRATFHGRIIGLLAGVIVIARRITIDAELLDGRVWSHDPQATA